MESRACSKSQDTSAILILTITSDRLLPCNSHHTNWLLHYCYRKYSPRTLYACYTVTPTNYRQVLYTSHDLLAGYISRPRNDSIAPKYHLALDSTAVESTRTVLTFTGCILHHYGVRHGLAHQAMSIFNITITVKCD